MSAVLRAGVAGAGVFGGFHAAKYAACDGAALVSVFDVEVESAKALAETAGAKAASSFAEFLDSVDIVSITAPAGEHAALALEALRAGKHVYIEKPIALTVADADAIIACAGAAGRVLQCGHQERFVLKGLGFGDAMPAPRRFEFWRAGPGAGRCEEVSVVVDLMIHDLDLAAALGADEPAAVKAAGGMHEVAATIDYADGASGSFLASRRAQKRRRGARLIYDNGEIEIDFLARQFRIDGSPPEIGVRDEKLLADPLQASVDAFVFAVANGAPPAISGAYGRRALASALKVEAARLEQSITREMRAAV